MPRFIHISLHVTVAITTVVALVLSTGIHVHFLLAHGHEDAPMHNHTVVIHAHEGALEPLPHSSGSDDNEHRHPVPSVQIVALPPSPMQNATPSVVELASGMPVNLSPCSTGEDNGILIATDASPPCIDCLTNDLSGRSPPLS